MKIRRSFFMLFVAVSLLGCKTKPLSIVSPIVPPPEPTQEPLTPGSLERLYAMGDFTNIKDYQFVLAGQVILTLVKNKRYDRNNVPHAGAVFENVDIRRRITFPNKSLGQALDVKLVGDRYDLRVCFEHPEDENKYPAETYYLVFSARKSQQNAYFYLRHDAPQADRIGEEKGTLMYGNETYTLLFNDEDRPHVILRLERKNTLDEENRTLRGRKVN